MPQAGPTALLARHAALTPSQHPTPPGYAPGRLRSESDAELALIGAFVSRFPEYGRLSHPELLQLAATYLSDGDHELRGRLRDEGVPVGWRRSAEELLMEEMGSDYV